MYHRRWREAMAGACILILAGCAQQPRFDNGSSMLKSEPAGDSATSATTPAASTDEKPADKPADASASTTPATADAPAATIAATPDVTPAPAPVIAAVTAETPVPAPVAAPAASASISDNSTASLIAQLNEATREMAALRVANAKLRAERDRAVTAPAVAAPAPAPVPETPPAAKPDPVDEKLKGALKSYDQFRAELAGMLAEVDAARADRASIDARLKDAAAQVERMRDSISRLQDDLRGEREARAQAEQAASKLREQLRNIAKAMSAAGLSADLAGSESPPTAELRTNPDRARDGGAATSTRQRHTVREGETLEKIADRYYGDPKKWPLIVDANRRRLPLDGTLPIGLELDIPAQ